MRDGPLHQPLVVFFASDVYLGHTHTSVLSLDTVWNGHWGSSQLSAFPGKAPGGSHCPSLLQYVMAADRISLSRLPGIMFFQYSRSTAVSPYSRQESDPSE